jgi:hypothetical protein
LTTPYTRLQALRATSRLAYILTFEVPPLCVTLIRPFDHDEALEPNTSIGWSKKRVRDYPGGLEVMKTRLKSLILAIVATTVMMAFAGIASAQDWGYHRGWHRYHVWRNNTWTYVYHPAGWVIPAAWVGPPPHHRHHRRWHRHHH